MATSTALPSGSRASRSVLWPQESILMPVLSLVASASLVFILFYLGVSGFRALFTPQASFTG